MDSNNHLLEIKNLRTWISTKTGFMRPVDGIDFKIHPGETFALLGESGCGKSMTAMSIMQLLPNGAYFGAESKILFAQQDLLQLSEVDMRHIRGKRISMIFQEPMTSLNPVLTVGQQIDEVCRYHTSQSDKARYNNVLSWLDKVGIPEPELRYRDYPHQLSGGMKQRVMIAMALAGQPDLLIADEPTTALDVTIQAQILSLLRSLQDATNMAILLITHDLAVVSQMADRLAVMYAGHIVEQGQPETFFAQPMHPYSEQLLESIPTMQHRGLELATIKGMVPTLNKSFPLCRFRERCARKIACCDTSKPTWTVLTQDTGVRCHLAEKGRGDKPGRLHEISRSNRKPSPLSSQTILQIDDLKVYFPIRKGLLKRQVGSVKAVDGVDITIKKGSTVALVGESGCGKTTIGKAILRLLQANAGQVLFAGQDLLKLKASALRQARKELQMIFQDPFSSLNPRMPIRHIIEEGMRAQKVLRQKKSRTQRIAKLLEQVGLSNDIMMRYPHEFSGGQRQRIAIARALAIEPSLIVCDEPTSALDVSVQAQILNLLKQLQQDLSLTYLFITHNMSVVTYLADYVAVMYLGRIVEEGPAQSLLVKPHHPYTQALFAAVPMIGESGIGTMSQSIQGEMPSPVNPPTGCHFHPRCPYAMAQCRKSYPGKTSIDDAHRVRCYLFEGATNEQ